MIFTSINFKELFGYTPVVFSNSECVDFKKSLKDTIDRFNYLFDHYLQDILFDRTKVRRRQNVNNYTFQEKIFLELYKDKLNISDDDKYDILINNSYCAYNDNIIIRVFFLNKPFNSGFLTETITSSIDNDQKYMISIFVGDEFENSDNNKISLVYDILETICIRNLNLINIPINNTSNNDLCIVFHSANISEITFIVYYYLYIFSVIYNICDKSVINYDYISKEIERPNISIFDSNDKKEEFMHKIWNCAKNPENEKEIRDTIIYIYNNL